MVSAVDCSDGNECTADVCDPSTSCGAVNLSAGSSCGDSSATACTAADTCDGAGACLANDQDGAQCDDGDACTANDSCLVGSCSVSDAVDCGSHASCDNLSDPVCVCDAGYDDVNDACVLSVLSLSAGELVITEIMRDAGPAVGIDGQWFEFRNDAGEDVSLTGLDIVDQGTDALAVAGALVIADGEYAVFCRSVGGGDGSAACDYVYGAVIDLDAVDELELSNATGVIDALAWDANTWPDVPGESMSLAPDADSTTNDDAQWWCGGAPPTPGSVNAGCNVVLVAVTRDSNELMSLDNTTFEITGAVAMTVAGGTIQKGLGLAFDPVTRRTFVVFKSNLPGSRHLGQVDPVTGVVADIGDLGDKFAAIAFDLAGQLYGVTGDGADTPETLFAIDKSNASTSEVVALGAGDDGETLALNPRDGLLYHSSGCNDSVWETIDPSGPTITPIGLTGDDFCEATALTYSEKSNSFVLVNLNSAEVNTVTTGGVSTELVVSPDRPVIKGLAFVAEGPPPVE